MLAYEKRIDDVSAALDVAEYLMAMTLEAHDRTDEFRTNLVDLATRFPDVGFARAVERFDSSE